MKKKTYKKKPSEQRFWNKVSRKNIDECWEWQASFKGSYGSFYVNGKNKLAHRFSWELHNGRIKDYPNVLVLHKCDNRKCVNPNHLFLGTQKDNIQDAIGKKRFVFNGIGNVGEKNFNSKLTTETVKIIRELYKRPDLSQRDLATEFGLNIKHVHQIVRNKIWKHI